MRTPVPLQRARREAQIDRAIMLVVTLLAESQRRGMPPAYITVIHHTACAWGWWRIRGRSAVLVGLRDIVKLLRKERVARAALTD